MYSTALALAAALATAASSASGTFVQTSAATISGTLINGGIFGAVPLSKWRCKKWDGSACNAADRANPSLKQIVILPTGFLEADETLFWSEFDLIVSLMTTAQEAGTSWSVQKRSQILFIGYFLPGGALGTNAAMFKASIPAHPIRGLALSLDQASVYTKITALTAEISSLRPMTVGVLFKSDLDNVTANAAPPSVIGKPFGVAKFTTFDLHDRGAYLPVHELAHAGLNFLDEYVEGGFEDLNISQIDVLTPLALFDSTWGGFVNSIADLLGIFDMRLSEILANNGSDNIATRKQPATVDTPGFSKEQYIYEGGMFFGRGTWHMQGNNVMDGGSVNRGPGDGFAFAHSPAQQAVVHEAFGATAHRPNDRLRNAGPSSSWPSALGSETKVMLFDGDKLHHFHPTRTYTVQVGWYERKWKTCWALFIPYPCSEDVWRVAERTAWAQERKIELRATAAYGLASLLQKVVCAVGITEIKSGNDTFRICDQDVDAITSAFLPTIVWRLPYQEVKVPASQWFTKYYYRFNTDNGVHVSGYTGWSSFIRTF